MGFLGSRGFRHLLGGAAAITLAMVLMAALEPAPAPSSVPPAPAASVSPMENALPSAESLSKDIDRLIAQFEREAAPPVREDYQYTIVSGDSLIGISKKIKNEYELAETPREIRQGIIVRNNMEDPRSIRAGDELTIPLSEFVKTPEIPPLDPRFQPVFRYWAKLDACHSLGQCLINDKAVFDQAPRTIIYTVQQGDSLYDIARFVREKEGLTLPLVQLVQEIAARNDIEDPRDVHPGFELEVALTDQRTMTGLLAYEGFAPRSGVLKLAYSKEEIEAFIAGALKKYTNIPRVTFMRMLRVESGGDHLAVSPVGAAGLMQIMPLTGKRLGLRVYEGDGYVFPRNIAAPGARAFYQRYARELKELAEKNPRKLMRMDDRFNPKKNVYASARLFSRLVNQFGTRNAVAAYNGGVRGTTSRRAAETRAYMSLVLR